jgi:hypothetical protein
MVLKIHVMVLRVMTPYSYAIEYIVKHWLPIEDSDARLEIFVVMKIHVVFCVTSN